MNPSARESSDEERDMLEVSPVRRSLSALRHNIYMIRKRPRRYIYWTRCWGGEERCLYRHDRRTYAFDRWIDNEWIRNSDAYWSVVSDTGYVASRRRARAIRRAFTAGESIPCRHATHSQC